MGSLLIGVVWDICKLQILFCVPLILACIHMSVSGHKSLHNTKYGALLVKLLCWTAFPVSILLSARGTLFYSEQLGAKFSDTFFGIQLLLFVADIAYTMVMATVFTDYVARKHAPNCRHK